ncbi:zinc finger protein 184-like [Belonocnema kinseyi]|uniref:zinc finger protein 184-like n=1 Tax=Belonocnema kinseyi TaxID=2817044 RepID=UPI00143D77AA|nr:zinc finger protein 184-like [Belonocnema kinseyi]
MRCSFETTCISSCNNSSPKNFIKYESDETLDIKEEILLDQEAVKDQTNAFFLLRANCNFERREFRNLNWKRTTEISVRGYLSNHQREHHNSIFENIYKPFTCKIEYSNDETLEIKEEIIEDQEPSRGPRNDVKYDSKCFTVDISETDIFGSKKRQRKNKKQKSQESEPGKKYTCQKCARSYKRKGHLTCHTKFECGVMPQFKCHFCEKRFKVKHHMTRHIELVHRKSNSNISVLTHKCNKCSRNYRSLSGLNRHNRVEHAEVKMQFTCDICGGKMKAKASLSKHIVTQHPNS